jgi:hypothetical protein
MPPRYQITASIRERHDELLSNEDNKSAVVQEALDMYYGLQEVTGDDE